MTISPSAPDGMKLFDYEPTEEDFRTAVLAGLRRSPRELPCKFFYDKRGSELFDQICALDEYYPTRTELKILTEQAEDIAATIGPRARLIELGSGSTTKARLVLNILDDPAVYVPVEISREYLMDCALELSEAFPGVDVQPVCADFTKDYDLPPCDTDVGRNVVFFAGSTIGNFQPSTAVMLLKRMRALAGAEGGVLIGAALKTDRARLERAYDDSEGVTAEFNLNILARIQRELDADIDLAGFRHRAVYNDALGRVEMHLVSTKDQTVTIGDERIDFVRDEHIHTENSYKFSLDEFADMARQAGLTVDHVWTDPKQLFSVHFLRPA